MSPVAAAAPEPTTPPVLRLIDQDFAIARDAPWHAQWHVEGTVPPGSVRVILYRPVDDRIELADDLAGDRQDVIDNISFEVTPSLRVDASGTVLDVSLPTTTATNVAEALTLRQPGLYPITVQLVDGDNVVAEDHTYIERLPVDPRHGAADERRARRRDRRSRPEPHRRTSWRWAADASPTSPP